MGIEMSNSNSNRTGTGTCGVDQCPQKKKIFYLTKFILLRITTNRIYKPIFIYLKN